MPLSTLLPIRPVRPIGRVSRRPSSWLGLAAILLLAMPTPSLATPTSYSVDQGTFSADISGSALVSISTSLGSKSLTLPFSGHAQSAANGSIVVDWGDPVTSSDPGSWLGQINVVSGDVSVSGLANTNITSTKSIDLYGYTTATFTVTLDSLGFDLTGPSGSFSSSTVPSGLNSLVWVAQDPIDVSVSVAPTYSFTGPVGGTHTVAPPSFLYPEQLSIDLGRSTNGSYVGLGDGAIASVPFSTAIPGGSKCVVTGLLGNCLFSYSYSVSLTSSITNVSWAGIQASSPAMIPLPEPSAVLLTAVAGTAFAIRKARAG